MKITAALVRSFEEDQKKHGTKVALSNIVWRIADDLLRDLGVKRVRTQYRKDA